MPKLRILQVCSADAAGGGERHVSDLTRTLARRGHELHLAVRRSSPLHDLLSDVEVIWHELPLRNALDLSSLRGLARIIREFDIEVIHGHLARDYPVCGLVARLTDARLFLTRHHFNRFAGSRVYEWSIGRAENLIAVSSSVAHALRQSFPRLAGRVVVIPNWPNLAAPDTGFEVSRAESRRVLGIRRAIAVGVVGQLTQLKRQDLFIEAAVALKNQGFSDVDFLVVGAAYLRDREYERGLHALVGSLKIEDQLQFVGHVPEFARYLAAFDLIVAPSDNEAFSLVLVEAMAAGIPVIATRVGGMAEIVEDGVSGLLVPPGNVKALTDGMKLLITDEDLRRQLAETAASSVRGRFDREKIVDQIEKLYYGGREEKDCKDCKDRKD